MRPLVALLLASTGLLVALTVVQACAGLPPPPEQDAADLCRYCRAHDYRSAAGCFGVRPGCIEQPQ